MTKKELSILKSHHRSCLTDLAQCYKNFSQLKWQAYCYERDTQYVLNGFNFRIIGYNSMMFSVGFYFYMNEELYFHYATNKTTKDFLVDISKLPYEIYELVVER